MRTSVPISFSLPWGEKYSWSEVSTVPEGSALLLGGVCSPMNPEKEGNEDVGSC